MATVGRRMRFRRGNIAFSETTSRGRGRRQAATFGVRRRTDVIPKIRPRQQNALSSRRECGFHNAGGSDCHGGAATFGLQRNRAMATVGRRMHFRRGNIAFSETTSLGGSRRQAATFGVRRRTNVISKIRRQRTLCAFARARVRF